MANQQDNTSKTTVLQQQMYETYHQHIHWPEIISDTDLWERIQQQPMQVDLSAMHSLDAQAPCEVCMITPSLTLSPHTLPHGYLRLVIRIEETNPSTQAQVWRYFKINRTASSFSFHFDKEPHADELTWGVGEHLVMDWSASFFAPMKPSYGISPEYPPIVNYSVSCTNHRHICAALQNTVLTKPMINVTKQHVRLERRSTNKFILTMKVTAKIDGNLTLSGILVTIVQLLDKGLIIDIVCVRNCQDRFLHHLPTVLMAKCYNCKDVDAHNIIYTWRGFSNAEGMGTKYLAIRFSSGDMNINVQGTTPPTRYSGWATRKFRAATKDPNIKLDDFNVLASSFTGIFDTFDVEISPGTSVDPTRLDVLPVRRYFENRETLGDVFVCSFGDQLTNVVLRAKKATKQITGDVGILLPDGTRYRSMIRPISSDPGLGVKPKQLVAGCQSTIDFKLAFETDSLVADSLISAERFRDSRAANQRLVYGSIDFAANQWPYKSVAKGHGFSDIFALAQEILDENFDQTDIKS
ncbi:hypothetical protein ElyMa_006492200, partial [Elysia marginata]